VHFERLLCLGEEPARPAALPTHPRHQKAQGQFTRLGTLKKTTSASVNVQVSLGHAPTCFSGLQSIVEQYPGEGKRPWKKHREPVRGGTSLHVCA